MGTVNKIDVQLEGKNGSRLQIKKYDKDFTNIPNNALPSALKSNIGCVFKNLSNKDFPEDGYTFLVKSQGGNFKKLFSPAVYKDPETNNLVIKWGEDVIPLSIENGTITSPQSTNSKLKLKFSPENYGKYKKTCIVASFTEKGDVYSMPFPLRSVKLEDELDVTELELLLEENPNALLDRVLELNTKSSDNYKGSSKLDGEYFIKISALPIGDYVVTGFKRYDNTYGVQHILQIEPVAEEFLATTRVKNEGGEWVDLDVNVGSNRFLVKANTKLNKLLLSDPIISEEFPANLVVLEKGEYNGNITAKVEFYPVSYTVDEEQFDTNF